MATPATAKEPIIKSPKDFNPQGVIFSTYDSFVDANSNNKRDEEELEAKRTLFLTYETTNENEGPANTETVTIAADAEGRHRGKT